jgi:hypothetical protein
LSTNVLLYMVLIIFEKFKQTDTDHSMEIKPKNQYGIGIKNDYDAAIYIGGLIYE